MVDAGIGARIGQWRRRRGISQVALAGLVGRSESWLSQVERGLRDVDSLTVLRELARVLRVGLDDLAPISAPEPRAHRDTAELHVERALLAPIPAEATTATRVAAVHAAYQDARYAEVLSGLQDLAAGLTGTTDPGVLAAGWTAAAKILTKVGAFDLALVAADRAREGAQRSGNLADLGMSTFQVVCALLPTTHATVGEELAARTASELGDDRTDAVCSVSGALWLLAALAAARRGDGDVANERLDQAQRRADALGRDDNLRWTAFGPTNVAVHRVSVAAELG